MSCACKLLPKQTRRGTSTFFLFPISLFTYLDSLSGQILHYWNTTLSLIQRQRLSIGVWVWNFVMNNEFSIFIFAISLLFIVRGCWGFPRPPLRAAATSLAETKDFSQVVNLFDGYPLENTIAIFSNVNINDQRFSIWFKPPRTEILFPYSFFKMR